MAEISENPQSLTDIEGNGSRRIISFENLISISFIQKLIGEFIGTFCMVFAGCTAIVVNERYGKIITLPGIALVWGLIVMVMIYSIGHISGAHFNPAVSIAFAFSRKFPFKQVPGYITSQILGSILASFILRLVFHLNNDVCNKTNGDVFIGTYPSGSNTISFVMEFVTTFNLMFVISAVATDKRAVGSFAGIAIGSTVVLDILFSGPISGASMNPARSMGPAMVWGCYKNVWIYVISPVMGAIIGAFAYDILRPTRHSFRQDHICVLKLIDPTNLKSFICLSPSDIPINSNVSCKFQ